MVDWIDRALVPVAIALAFALFRRLAPAPVPASEHWEYEKRQKPEPLPTGVIGATMWGIGLCLLCSFFVFREANHLWAVLDGPAVLCVYETPTVWCFFPGFAALTIPWPLTLWLLRRLGRNDEADEIIDRSSAQAGMNSYVVLKWMSYGLALPIGIATILAIPIHLSIGDSEAKVGHYGKLGSEIFRFDQAVSARLVKTKRDQAGRTGHPGENLLIDFKDGRRLDANVGGDGGTAASPEVVKLLFEKTRLEPVVQ